MENPEKPLTVASAALAQPIRHVAAITVLLNLTDYEIADTFLLRVNTLADWKQQPEWKEASAAFAKAHFAPTFKKSMTKGGSSREITRQLILYLIRSAPPGRRVVRAMQLSWHLTTERVRCKTAKKRPKALSLAKKFAMQQK
jgi:hypothetical protein